MWQFLPVSSVWVTVNAGPRYEDLHILLTSAILYFLFTMEQHINFSQRYLSAELNI